MGFLQHPAVLSWVVSSFFHWWLLLSFSHLGCVEPCWCGVITQTIPISQDILCQRIFRQQRLNVGSLTRDTPFPSHFSQTCLVLSCIYLWVCGSDSLHFPVFCQDQQRCLAPGGVSPHLSCYFRFLAVELLGSCPALNVSGVLSQRDSTRHTLGEVERFDFLCQKHDFMHFGLLNISPCCFKKPRASLDLKIWEINELLPISPPAPRRWSSFYTQVVRNSLAEGT